MSLAKTITKQFVKMAKDSDRIQNSVDQMKDKIINESLNIVKKAGIDPSQLPFNINELMTKGPGNPSALLTPEKICSVPPLTNSQKNSANIAITKSNQQLTNIISNTNALKTALIAIKAPIQSIKVLGQTTEGFVNSLSNVIKIIKAIPIPTAFGAPAVALPVKVLTILSSTLIKLDKKVEIAKGTIKIIPPMIGQISEILNTVIIAVNGVEKSIEGALTLTSFVKSVVELGDACDINTDLYIVDSSVNDGNTFVLDRVDGLNIGMTISSVSEGNVNNNTTITNINTNNTSITLSSNNTLSRGTGIVFISYEGSGVSQGDIDNVTNNVTGVLTAALNASGDSSLLDTNQLSEAELIASFPFEYKGFNLELLYNPEEEISKFPFPSRKILATRDFSVGGSNEAGINTIFVRTKFNTPLGKVALYNDPGGQARYSFSSSVAVLVEEMKYKIDNYLTGVNELALPSIVSADGGKAPSGTQEYFDNAPQNPAFFNPNRPNAGPVDLFGGSDDPPSPTGSNAPPSPPAFYFNNPNAFTDANPSRLIASGSFTVTSPVKIKMTTFGGTFPLDGESRGFLRIYKQGVPGYSFMMEDQYAEMQETITTRNNPSGYYQSGNFTDPEYWPINPGFANGTITSNLGIFQYVLELTDYTGQPDGSSGNFTKFEIEAQ